MSEKTAGVAFTCNTLAGANLVNNAVNLYRHVLKQRGQDPRNYAPAIPGEAAGFGWDAVQRAARDMGAGTTTYMSRRMAEAMRDALLAKAERTPDRDQHVMAKHLAERLTALIEQARA